MTNPAESDGEDPAKTKLDELTRRYEVRDEFLTTGRPYLEEQEAVREALRELATKLRALGDAAHGELAAEARLVWLDSLLPLREVADLVRALSHVEAVCSFVDNWTDCCLSPRETKREESDRYDNAARTAHEERRRLEKQGAPTTTATDVLGLAAEMLDHRAERLRAVETPAAEAREEAFDEGFLTPAREAAQKALVVFCGIVDAMRDRAPEVLK